jgi:hypothetical protein
MNPSYNNISLATGAHIAGICEIKIVPREWIIYTPVIDFNTGKVTTALIFIDSLNWLVLQLAPDSYSYIEKPKTNKTGSYFEINISGLINYFDAALLQQLETIRYNEVVALVKDNKGQYRLVGTKEIGLQLEIGNVQSNKQDGLLEVSIEMTMQNSYASPFYEL